MITIVADLGEILHLSNGMTVMREDAGFYLGTDEES